MILFRYLTKEVYTTVLATVIVLLLVFICNQFIHYLSQAAAGKLPIKAVLQLMSLQVPLLLGYLLPLALFVGILLVYSRLYVDNEMTVLFACGVSPLRLLGITMGFSLGVMAVVAFLTLWVEPHIAGFRDRIFAEAAVASPIEKMFPGRFETLGNGQWVVYVQSLSQDRQNMSDVFAAKLPKTANEPWTIVAAEGGYQWQDKKTGDQFIVLTKGHRYLGIPGQGDFQIMDYDKYGIRMQTGKADMGQQQHEEYLPTLQLLKESSKGDPQTTAELQWRLTMPLSTLILAFIAVPLSRVKTRKGKYARLLPALVLYIAYADLIFLSQAWIQQGTISARLGMWWVHGIMLLLAIILMANFAGWYPSWAKSRLKKQV
ncbi:MAG: LPS export ABC transporter permease LptF [Gammaproteobacteria bacterium]